MSRSRDWQVTRIEVKTLKNTRTDAESNELLSVRLSRDELARISWFAKHAGRTVSWPGTDENGVRLTSKAKGIYKPRESHYVASIRQSMDGKYAADRVHRREDGSWFVYYAGESQQGAASSKLATNTGMLRCMNDRVPVGVIVQVKRKPDPRYRIEGLAIPVAYDENKAVFRLEGIASGEQIVEQANHFEMLINERSQFLEGDADLKTRRQVEQVVREGQELFRRNVLAAYGFRCAISGCDVERALHAAHITPYNGPHSNVVQNGLALRADLHQLFDAGYLLIDPVTRRVVCAGPANSSDHYKHFDGRTLVETQDPKQRPAAAYLASKWTNSKTAPGNAIAGVIPPRRG